MPTPSPRFCCFLPLSAPFVSQRGTAEFISCGLCFIVSVRPVFWWIRRPQWIAVGGRKKALWTWSSFARFTAKQHRAEIKRVKCGISFAPQSCGTHRAVIMSSPCLEKCHIPTLFTVGGPDSTFYSLAVPFCHRLLPYVTLTAPLLRSLPTLYDLFYGPLR